MDVDQVIEAAEVNIEFYEYRKASQEPPWDGFCGLVRVCDDDSFKEHGVIRRTPAPASHKDKKTGIHRSAGAPGPSTTGSSSEHMSQQLDSSVASALASPAPTPVLSPNPPPQPSPSADDGPLPDWVMEYVMSAARSSPPSDSGSSGGLSSGSIDSEVAELLSMVQTEVQLEDQHADVFTSPADLLAAMPSPPKPKPPAQGS